MEGEIAGENYDSYKQAFVKLVLVHVNNVKETKWVRIHSFINKNQNRMNQKQEILSKRKIHLVIYVIYNISEEQYQSLQLKKLKGEARQKWFDINL